jgi:hypothetical protein
VLGLDPRDDRLALGLGQGVPAGAEVGLAGAGRLGLGAGRGAAGPLGGGRLAADLGGVPVLGREVLGGAVVAADRGDEVAGRVLADPLVAVLGQPVEDLQPGPDPPRRVGRD